MTKGRLAAVAATAGTSVGGAETVVREMAVGLGRRGWEVDLLTSRAEDIYTWDNVAPGGTTSEDAITVRRFDAVGLSNPPRDRLGARILGGESLPMADQYRWVNSGMRVPALYDYLVDHASEYRVIFCGPYMFWAGLVLADLAPERSIGMPCLHDEPFARMEIYRYQLTSMRGLWFLSPPEAELARRLGLTGRRVSVIGSAIDPAAAVDMEGFRARARIDEPFVFYSGRREWGKGWPRLMADMGFAAGVLGERLPPLVTCGVGEVGTVPPGVRVVDLGVVPDPVRAAGQAAAAAYIQPSAMESFSRSVLEAFAAGTPVFANAASDVVRWHCERSGAGLTYSNRYELVECLRLVSEDPDLLHQMGKAGPDYVLRDFSWSKVLDRVEGTIEEWA